MKRLLILGGAAVAVIGLAACEPKTERAKAVAPDARPAATVPTARNEAAAPDFVALAGAGDMFETAAGRLALERSKTPAVRAFAQQMVEAHNRTTADLKAAILNSGLSLRPPAVLPEAQADRLADLTAADAAAFDIRFMDGQVDAHQATLDLMTRYAQDGDNPALKAFAASKMPIVQQHLDQARAIRDGLT